MERLLADAKSKDNTKITVKAVISTSKAPHVLNTAVVSFCNVVAINGLSYFTPSIVQGLGYGKTQTQLLSVPPYANAVAMVVIAATSADRCH